MMKRRIGACALFAAFAFCGGALAASPTQSQYGPPNENGGNPPPTGPLEPPSGLPFTGFQAGLFLMSGLAAVAAGVTLRSTAGQRRTSRLAVAATEKERIDSHGDDLLFLSLARPLEWCEICGKHVDPSGFRVSLGSGGRSFHSFECATRASGG